MEPDKVVVKSSPDEDEDEGHEPEDLAQNGTLADKVPGKAWMVGEWLVDRCGVVVGGCLNPLPKTTPKTCKRFTHRTKSKPAQVCRDVVDSNLGIHCDPSSHQNE